MPYCPACNTKYEDAKKFCPKDGTELQENEPPAVPSRVGQILADRYRIARLLGAGGMGEVYEAEHVYLNKRVALKLLRPEITGNKEAVERFQREARSTSEIGHENIVTVDDFGKLPDGSFYCTMEFLEGEELARVMLKKPLDPPHALGIVVQICRGLAAAHAKGIIHRDMKPENVFLTKDKDGKELAKILDFGIAKVNDPGNDNLTKTGSVFGTPHYMSPEQAMGKHLDARADIYSVGVMMYEMFTGTVPFKADSFIGILTKHVTESVVPPRQAAPGREIHPEIETVILKAMDKMPENRYRSMEEMLDALAAVERSVSSFHDVVRPMSPLAEPPPPMDGGGSGGGWTQMSAAQQAVAEPMRSGPYQSATGPNVSQPPINPGTMPPPGMAGGTASTSQPMLNGGVSTASQPYIPGATVPPVGGKSSAGLVAVIVVLAVVLLGGGGAGAWYFLWGPGSGDSGESSSSKKAEDGETKEKPEQIEDKKDKEDKEDITVAEKEKDEKEAVDSGKKTDEQEVAGAGPGEVFLQTIPSAVDVRLRGRLHCKTPCALKMPKEGELSVMLALRGYETEVIRFGKDSPEEFTMEMRKIEGGKKSGLRVSTPRKDGTLTGTKHADPTEKKTKERPTKPKLEPVTDPKPQRKKVKPGFNPFDDDKPLTVPKKKKPAHPFDD